MSELPGCQAQRRHQACDEPVRSYLNQLSLHSGYVSRYLSIIDEVRGPMQRPRPAPAPVAQALTTLHAKRKVGIPLGPRSSPRMSLHRTARFDGPPTIGQWNSQASSLLPTIPRPRSTGSTGSTASTKGPRDHKCTRAHCIRRLTSTSPATRKETQGRSSRHAVLGSTSFGHQGLVCRRRVLVRLAPLQSTPEEMAISWARRNDGRGAGYKGGRQPL